MRTHDTFRVPWGFRFSTPLLSMAPLLSEIPTKFKIGLGILLWAVLVVYLEHDDLASGNIPASDRAPSEHWGYIWRHRERFVRDYSRHAKRDRMRWLTRGSAAGDYTQKHGTMRDYVESHMAEEIDPFGKSGAATRCATTNYAITSYFCGTAVADNRDEDYKNLRSLDQLGRRVEDFEEWAERTQATEGSEASLRSRYPPVLVKSSARIWRQCVNAFPVDPQTCH